MATYKAIQGQTVQKLSADPAASAVTEGLLFYNSTDGAFRVIVASNGGFTVQTVTVS